MCCYLCGNYRLGYGTCIDKHSTFIGTHCHVLLITGLTHWGWVTHICIGNLTIIGSYNGLTVPSHYLNQCWNVVNWTLRNKLQWNFNSNSSIFIQENAFENVVWEMSAILSQPQCVNTLRPRQDCHHFCRQHFWMHFLEWELLHFDSNFTEVCSQGSNANIHNTNAHLGIFWFFV